MLILAHMGQVKRTPSSRQKSVIIKIDCHTD